MRELMRDGGEGVEFALDENALAPGETRRISMYSGGCGRMNVVVRFDGRAGQAVTPINTCNSGEVTITD